MDFETRAIHAGQEPDPATGAVITPIYQTSTYVQEAVGVHKGYDYSRVANPTRTALADRAREPRGRRARHRVLSGLGATTTLMHLVDPGERVVLIADVYGGVYRMTSQVYEPKGYRFTYVPADEFDENLAVASRRRRAARVGRDAVEPAAEHRRHPPGRRRGARRRRAARRRQHLRLAVPAAAARARRRRSSSTRRRSTSAATRDAIGGFVATNDDALGRAARLPAEVARRRARPVRRLARPARDQDARRADAPALRERARRSPSSSTAIPAVERVLYPGLPNHPGHEVARAPDARLRRHGLVPRRVRGGGRRARRAHEALPARRVARRRREPDRAPGPDDARLDRRRAVRRAAQPRPPLGRDRGGRRPARRPRGRARRRRRPRVRAWPSSMLEPIDLDFLGRPHAIGVVPGRDDRRPGALRLRPRDDAAAARRAALARARPRARPTSATCCSRTSTSTTRARPASLVREHPELTVWVSEIGAPHLVDPSRLEALGAPALRRALRPALGRARAGARRRTSAIADGRRARLGGVPDARATPRTTSATSATGRCSPATRAACASSRRPTSLPVSPPPDIDVEAWHATIAEIERRAPERLALIHFGVATDVGDAPRPARRRARPLGRPRARRAGRGASSSRPRAPDPGEDADVYDRGRAVRPVVAGAAPLLGQARRAAAATRRQSAVDPGAARLRRSPSRRSRRCSRAAGRVTANMMQSATSSAVQRPAQRDVRVDGGSPSPRRR